MERGAKYVLVLISLMVVVAIAVTAWLFLYKKQYRFEVEGACNPATEACFHRDCSTGDCPPNNLEDYKVYMVRAADFPRCSDNSCASECASGTIQCVAVRCGDKGEDSCSSNPEKSAE